LFRVGPDEDDDELAAFFQEVQEDAKIRDIRKVSIAPGYRFFRVGPEVS
jgi:hypothetical protein